MYSGDYRNIDRKYYFWYVWIKLWNRERKFDFFIVWGFFSSISSPLSVVDIWWFHTISSQCQSGEECINKRGSFSRIIIELSTRHACCWKWKRGSENEDQLFNNFFVFDHRSHSKLRIETFTSVSIYCYYQSRDEKTLPRRTCRVFLWVLKYSLSEFPKINFSPQSFSTSGTQSFARWKSSLAMGGI